MALLACDIKNAYLTAKCRENIYIIAGEEFSSEAGSIMIVKMALYVLKSSGVVFGDKLGQVLYDMNYRPSRADPDVWMRPDIKGDGFKYSEYVLCYIDDVLCILYVPLKKIEVTKDLFQLKGDKAEPPEMYLGAVLQRDTNNDGTEFWAMSSEEYLDDPINNVEENLAKHELKF